MDGCTFSNCRGFNVADPKVSFNIPTEFRITSSLQRQLNFKNDDFKQFQGYAKAVLGDIFERHKSAYENAKRCGNKKFVPHRLIYLDDRIEASILGLAETPPNADFPALVEISFFKFLLEKFKTNRSWAEFSDELRSTGSFVHHLISLIYIYINRLRHVSIDFVASGKNQTREADLVMYTPLKDKIDVEVKAPELLWGSEEITDEQAEKIVKKCWKSSKGQRKGDTSILVIGGTYVPDKNMARMGDAAANFLERRKSSNVLLIDVISYTMLVEKPHSMSPLVFGPETTMRPQFKRRTLINPYYEGIVQVFDSGREVEGIALAERETTEISVGPMDATNNEN